MRVRGQQVLASVANPESASTEYRQALGTSRTNKRKCPLMPPVDATLLNPDQLRDMLLGMLQKRSMLSLFSTANLVFHVISLYPVSW